jgi:hypothetical protein
MGLSAFRKGDAKPGCAMRRMRCSRANWPVESLPLAKSPRGITRHLSPRVMRPVAPSVPLTRRSPRFAGEHEAVLATRNGKDFEGTGVIVIDPWMAI